MTAVTYVTFLLTRQYTKNPELCNVRCGDEFGLELNWNGALNPALWFCGGIGAAGHALNVFFSLCLNPRHPGKVLNRLNARQSEIFTEFPLKDSFELLYGIWCFFRNVERFQKLCWFARWQNNRACAYYKIGMSLTLKKFTLTSAVGDI